MKYCPKSTDLSFELLISSPLIRKMMNMARISPMMAIMIIRRKNPWWPFSRFLKKGKTEMVILPVPRVPSCAKMYAYDRKMLNSPISGVVRYFGKIRADVMKPISTPE